MQILTSRGRTFDRVEWANKYLQCIKNAAFCRYAESLHIIYNLYPKRPLILDLSGSS